MTFRKTGAHPNHRGENEVLHPPEVERAKKACSLLAALGTPSIADLKTAIAMNAIAGLPVTTKDVDLAEKIFGPDLGTHKGRTTCWRPLPLVQDLIQIPPELYEQQESIEFDKLRFSVVLP